MKEYLLKLFCNIVIVGDSQANWWQRVVGFCKIVGGLSPIAFIIGALEAWYLNYEGFCIAMIIIVFINATLGGVMRHVYGGFSWGILLMKTMLMIIIIGITYLVLEIIISTAGDNPVVSGFRVTLQVATLLFPGTKIIKNIYIISRGEYPPEWLMKRVYNFNKNGDLKEFFDSKIDNSNNQNLAEDEIINENETK